MHHISGLHCDLKAAAIPASVQHVEHTRLLAQAGSRSYGGKTHAVPLSGAERECRRRACSLSPRTRRRSLCGRGTRSPFARVAEATAAPHEAAGHRSTGVFNKVAGWVEPATSGLLARTG